MGDSYLIPLWFFGFDIAMELLFGVVTAWVALFAFQIYNVTKERKIKLFAFAFLLTSLSYIILGALNFWFAHLITENFREVSLANVKIAGMVCLYAYMFLFTGGLVTLTYVTSDMKKGKTYYLLLGLSFLVIAVSLQKLATFSILSVFLLSFIAYQYVTEYFKNKNKKAFWTSMAFILLLVASFDFILSTFHYGFYIAGHIVRLLAYIIILFILIKSVRK